MGPLLLPVLLAVGADPACEDIAAAIRRANADARGVPDLVPPRPAAVPVPAPQPVTGPPLVGYRVGGVLYLLPAGSPPPFAAPAIPQVMPACPGGVCPQPQAQPARWWGR